MKEELEAPLVLAISAAWILFTSFGEDSDGIAIYKVRLACVLMLVFGALVTIARMY